jgi:hypothetical protein
MPKLLYASPPVDAAVGERCRHHRRGVVGRGTRPEPGPGGDGDASALLAARAGGRPSGRFLIRLRAASTLEHRWASGEAAAWLLPGRRS